MTSTRDADDVADLEVLERHRGGGAQGGRAGLRALLLDRADLVAHGGVLREVTQVAGHRLRIAGEGLVVAAHCPHQADDGAIRLELREGGLEDLPSTPPSELAHEVDGHVVRGSEAGTEWIGPGRGETGHALGIEAPVPDDDGVTLDVDAAATGPPGQLGVLGGRDIDVALAVELDQLLEDDGPGRHVDPKGEGLGCEDSAHATLREQLLDDLAEGRQHARVVRGEPPRDALDEVPVAEDREVLLGDALDPLLDEPPVRGPLRIGDEAHPGGEQLTDRRLAPGPAEDERDGRQQAFPVEAVDDLGPGCATARAPAAGKPAARIAGARPARLTATAPTAPVVSAAVPPPVPSAVPATSRSAATVARPVRVPGAPALGAADRVQRGRG